MNTDLVPQTGTMQSKSYDSLQLELSEKKIPFTAPFLRFANLSSVVLLGH